MALKTVFYQLKPLIPRVLQVYIRRIMVQQKLLLCKDYWPIDKHAGVEPLLWSRWPLGKRFAFVLTHDVEKEIGHRHSQQLAEIEERMGFVSSFNFVPERYNVSAELRADLMKRGFEIGVHDLNHDGKLFSSRKVFAYRKQRINKYLKEWEAVGFRAAAMHHNLSWIGELKIEYDSSTFDTDPFEPQPDGVGTIFPFWVKRNGEEDGFVELPYTIPQDFTIFILMRNATIDVWMEKLNWIVEKGGMALINVHPDYINFDSKRSNGVEGYPVRYYEEFLKQVKEKYENQYWNVVPKDVARFIKSIKCKEYADSAGTNVI